MSDIPRFELHELVARYQFEPGLADIFVEGEFDRDLLAHCIARTPMLKGVAVYPIDAVRIDSAELRRLNLDEGNKQRVIALSRLLASTEMFLNVRCIVDRDLDHWLGPLEASPLLRWTAYSSIELYFYSEEIVFEILRVAAGCKIHNPSLLFASFEKVLLMLYVLRLAAVEMMIPLRWITFDRCLSRSGVEIELDHKEYAKRVALASGGYERLEDLVRSAETWLQKVAGDPRLAIRGHDLVELLAWTARTFGGQKEIANAKVIERILILMVERGAGLVQLLL